MKYQPPTGAVDPNESYVGRDIAAGRQGSRVPPKAIEQNQRELHHLVEYAGLQPSDDDLEQVRKAIQSLILSHKIGLGDLLRAPFVVVNSATVTSPPASPVLGDTYAIPANALGAWSGLGGQLAQWNGAVWITKAVPLGHLVVVADAAVDSVNRYRRSTGTEWVSAYASSAAVGLVRLATQNEANGGTEAGAVLTPAVLRGLQVPNFRYERISMTLAENTETTVFNFDSGSGLILMPNSTFINNVLTIGEAGLWDFLVAVRSASLSGPGFLEVGLIVNGLLSTTETAGKTGDFSEAMGVTYSETRTIPAGTTVQARVKHRNASAAARDLYVRFLGKRVAS